MYDIRGQGFFFFRIRTYFFLLLRSILDTTYDRTNTDFQLWIVHLHKLHREVS